MRCKCVSMFVGNFKKCFVSEHTSAGGRDRNDTGSLKGEYKKKRKKNEEEEEYDTK